MKNSASRVDLPPEIEDAARMGGILQFVKKANRTGDP